MKIIYNINKVIFIITLVLYFTVVGGMLSQVILGALQIISAIILLLSWGKFSKKTKEHLSIYWVIIGVYGICWIFWLHNWDTINEFAIVIATVMVIPMVIATYFLYILNSIKHLK
nr:hypothetical protein [uncultured Psychroserpens sp.]